MLSRQIACCWYFGMEMSDLTVKPGDQPFIEDGGRSYTLPARYYTSDEVFRAEKGAIFDVSWVYVGHRSQVQKTGDFFTATVYDEEIFVVRGDDGTLNGFFNVCRHRGHHVVEGAGRASALTCRYHGWVYGLDGTLKKARNSQNVEGFDACQFSLAPIQVDDFCGLLFVNLDPNALPLRQQAPGLEAEIRHYCPEVDSLEFARRDAFDVRANWKTLVDNFLECYHCAVAHRDFVNLVDMDSYRTVVHEIHSSQLSDGLGNTESTAFSYKQGAVDFSYAGWFLWPNLTIWVYPGDPNLSVLQMSPTGPEHCVEFQDWFCVGAQPTAQLKEAMNYQRDVLQPEDIALCESVQKGLRSNAYNQGRFIVDRGRTELSEHAVHHFQTLVAKALGRPLT